MIDSIKVEEVKSDGTKKEINTDPSSGYHNYLVMFNTLIDLDFGIKSLINGFILVLILFIHTKRKYWKHSQMEKKFINVQA